MSVYKTVRDVVANHSSKRPVRVSVEKAANGGGYIAETSRDGEYPPSKSIHKTHMDVANHIKAMCK